MIKDFLNDTIVAISTPVGESGIGIVRLSGKDALSIVDKIFLSKDGNKPSRFKTYTTHYGWIVENSKLKTPACPAGRQNAKIKRPEEFIDEVILTVMRAPKSYTKEDVVEINCHGGIVALRRVLDLVLERGCRLAEPGEFTKRAFLNGRIDLSQAEAVLDIIKAKTDLALKLGVEQLKGILSKKINKIRAVLLDIVSQIEANIDFPEEEIDALNLKGLYCKLEDVSKGLEDILDTSRQGRVLREGINVVICGKPNVGKSSLLNVLLKQERSIVTPIAGTTRDTIEEVLDIRGIPIKIVDTAGIIEPKDIIEKKAVSRSKRYMELADLVILVFDGSRQLSQEDILLMKRLDSKPTLAVINKIDLRQKINKKYLLKRFKNVVEISCLKNKNISLFEEEVTNYVWQGKAGSQEGIFISNLRHIQLLKKTARQISQALSSFKKGLSLEFIAQDIKEALFYLDDILGKRFCQDLLDKIFSDFCIGK